MSRALHCSTTMVGFLFTAGQVNVLITLTSMCTICLVGSVVVWGDFTSHYRTDLYRDRDKILKLLVLPCLQRVGPHAVAQDDNPRPHRANVFTNFLRQNDVAQMDWPADY